MDPTEARKDTRFQPGQSGNPAGKKPGTRNRATLLIEQMMGDEAERLGRVAIDEALVKKAYAVRACLDRIASRPRRQAVVIDIPKVDTSAGVLATGARLVGDLLDGQRPAIETIELERRIAVLEGRLGLAGEAAAAA